MKTGYIFCLVLLANMGYTQPCKLLTDTFREADKLRKDNAEFQRFRFSTEQLDQVQLMPGLEKGVIGIKNLQRVLDQDFASYTQHLFWQLDEKLATYKLSEVQKECPETSFKVYADEIVYYQSKYRAFDSKVDKNVKTH